MRKRAARAGTSAAAVVDPKRQGQAPAAALRRTRRQSSAYACDMPWKKEIRLLFQAENCSRHQRARANVFWCCVVSARRREQKLQAQARGVHHRSIGARARKFVVRQWSLRCDCVRACIPVFIIKTKKQSARLVQQRLLVDSRLRANGQTRRAANGSTSRARFESAEGGLSSRAGAPNRSVLLKGSARDEA